MQRIIQRTAAAERQAARRAARQTGKRENEAEFRARQQLKAKTATSGMYIKSERERRREVYAAGALAPRLDAGENIKNFATVDPHILQDVERPWSRYRDDVIPFEEGDRVVIVSGRDKGKISRIVVLNRKAGHAKLQGLNQVCRPPTSTASHIPQTR